MVQIVRIIGGGLAGFYFLMKVRQMLMDKRTNPSMYFDIASYFFDTFFLIPMYLALGRKSRAIEEVFQELQQSPYARDSLHNGSSRVRKSVSLDSKPIFSSPPPSIIWTILPKLNICIFTNSLLNQFR
jgi:hypothetical protein